MEVTILGTVHDALAGKHILDPADKDGKMICPCTVLSHAEAEGLTRVLSALDIPADPRETLCEDHATILEDLAGHQDLSKCRVHPVRRWTLPAIWGAEPPKTVSHYSRAFMCSLVDVRQSSIWTSLL
jgi:hypothetical protein